MEQVKSFKLSLNRIEFKIIEETSTNTDLIKIDELNKITEIKDSILNYNRLNPSLNFENFIKGSSNDIALSYSKKFVSTSRGIILIYMWRCGPGKNPLIKRYRIRTSI